ncbi:MAG: hypothetical protein WB586_12465 [Chthoniobacterales bacterium]
MRFDPSFPRREVLIDTYDHNNRGWGAAQKWLDWDIIEYCMSVTLRGDKDFERMARETLAVQLDLMDPAWGGVYQYSTDGDWQHPHFEKIMQLRCTLRSWVVRVILPLVHYLPP